MTRPIAPFPAKPEPISVQPLCRDDLPIDTETLARFLVGKTLIHEIGGVRLSGRIVETEAYVPGDASSHAFRGETRRTRSMFGERGHAYVYIAYGVWPSMNVVGETPGVGGGVLLRALEPFEGIADMQLIRGTDKLFDLARGPGRLASAMRITPDLDGADLCAAGPLRLAGTVCEPAALGVTTRIGISKEIDRPLRFFERGSPFVSGARRLLAL